MPRKPTPAGKQRVRTGCLTCRKRRRKCDEQKPRCANCEVKGFTCKYGADLAFVPSRSGAAAGGGTGQLYNAITFVDDSPLAVRKGTSQQLDKITPVSQVASQQPSSGMNETAYQSARESRTTVPIDNMLTSNVSIGFAAGPSNLQDTPDVFLDATSRGTSGTHPIPEYLSFLTSPRQIPRRPTTAHSCRETDLLRHFRYHIGPWIDVGDPERAFGVQTLLLSRSNRPLQAAILALSAGQRSLLSGPHHYHEEDMSNSIRFRKEAEESLEFQPDLVEQAGHAILLLQDLLPSGLHRWRSWLDSADNHLSPMSLTEDLGEALFWLHFRLDLASSIVTSKAPLISFRSFLHRDGSPIHASRLDLNSRSVHRVYDHALCLLGHSLALIYGAPGVDFPQAAGSPQLAAFPSMRQSHFLSQWTFLWTDCQKWYNERPVDAQQIVDVRGGEADQIDPDHSSSFPILIFTTPMALVANAVYHITSLLLLTHKPRLLKSLPGPRCFTSHIWHAQSIAGIAASNDSSEQWDPILVASLLSIARDMSHESQQAVLLERLRRITATTGINLEQETEALRSVWRMARYDEESDDHATNSIMS
ncbi:hypothetical protein N7523_000910 [Penicillium sp. IBT 18751x]|nr:hypothetical protein N7523_000910 [Penicillium sp. IBT 18751x]